MSEDNIWERVIGLTNEIFQLTSCFDLLCGDQWQALVGVSLSQANERLESVKLLLDKGDQESSVILTRSLFELAANLSYLSKNATKRLPQYLKHGGIPTTMEEAQQLQQEVDNGAQPAAKDIIPERAWRRLKGMCCDLGSDWLNEYETFYRYASVPTHAGAFTLGSNYKQLLNRQPPSDRRKAVILTTASSFHLRVAGISAKTFPEEISFEKIQELRIECRLLGQQLAKLKN